MAAFSQPALGGAPSGATALRLLAPPSAQAAQQLMTAPLPLPLLPPTLVGSTLLGSAPVAAPQVMAAPPPVLAAAPPPAHAPAPAPAAMQLAPLSQATPLPLLPPPLELPPLSQLAQALWQQPWAAPLEAAPDALGGAALLTATGAAKAKQTKQTAKQAEAAAKRAELEARGAAANSERSRKKWRDVEIRALIAAYAYYTGPDSATLKGGELYAKISHMMETDHKVCRQAGAA